MNKFDHLILLKYNSNYVTCMWIDVSISLVRYEKSVAVGNTLQPNMGGKHNT